ncbi:hypothetical protein HPB51_027380 [Rhipicephalus microplus]|uniref:SWIM-type domain-containing protein n=1 Tax=Rhipicephalus microplus TaxID=6941 RepID=A0A9J6D086_RHIMP|nr:hypothetical protein HPB51_027380 [Rhipicephalus microplus]
MSEPPDRQKVIEKYLQGLRHDDGYSHGYLKSDEELKLFERSLAAVNESNQIQAVLKKDRFSTVDQENARILIEKIRGEQPESSVVYRPYAARSFVGSSDSDNVEEGVASECEDTLLFCFLTKFMRSMLKKYGGSVVCLDATHKTSDYALPLFLLVVKTPSGYTPAGVFIIQFETAHCIAEALDVFKQWCDNWSPQYWMVDYSKAEISAIKQVFPESQISIYEALRLMKHVASALNQHDFDKAVEDLVDSEYWKNERFRSYFEEVSLSVKELWVMSYRLEFDAVLTTNNGIEAQNRVLKALYVKSSSGKRSSTSLIITVIHGYLRDKEAKFHEAARRQSSAYRQYSENVPAYLHNRPHGFVKHMLRRLVNAEQYTPTDMEELPLKVCLRIHSERSDDDLYTVDFTKPSCTCPDFRKHKYPCKHFCVVFKYSDRWGFSSLPQSYLNRPQITLGSCPESEYKFRDSPCQSAQPF